MLPIDIWQMARKERREVPDLLKVTPVKAVSASVAVSCGVLMRFGRAIWAASRRGGPISLCQLCGDNPGRYRDDGIANDHHDGSQ